MQIIQGQDGNLYVVTQNGLQRLLPQQLQELLAGQQQPPQSELLSSFQKGIQSALKDQGKEALLGGEAASAAAGEAAGGGAALGEAVATSATTGEAMGAPLSTSVASSGVEPVAGMFDLSGFGSAGNVLAPIAGTALAANLAMSQGDAASGGGRNIRGFGQGAAAGAGLGSYFGPVGAAIGGGIGGLAGLAGSVFGSSKGERQMTRDEWRKKMLEKGSPLFGEDYQGTLADETTKFDWGKDKFGFGKGEGDFDLSNPTIGKAAAYGNTLAALQGYSGKDREAIATQFLGASTANLKDPNDIKTVRENTKKFMRDMGITNRDTAQMALSEASRRGMSEQEWRVFSSDLDELFAPQPNESGFDKNGNWVGVKR